MGVPAQTVVPEAPEAPAAQAKQKRVFDPYYYYFVQALGVTEERPAIRIVSSNAKVSSKALRYKYAPDDEFGQAVRSLGLRLELQLASNGITISAVSMAMLELNDPTTRFKLLHLFDLQASAASLTGDQAEKNILAYVQKYVSGELSPINPSGSNTDSSGGVEREL